MTKQKTINLDTSFIDAYIDKSQEFYKGVVNAFGKKHNADFINAEEVFIDTLQTYTTSKSEYGAVGMSGKTKLEVLTKSGCRIIMDVAFSLHAMDVAKRAGLESRWNHCQRCESGQTSFYDDETEQCQRYIEGWYQNAHKKGVVIESQKDVSIHFTSVRIYNQNNEIVFCGERDYAYQCLKHISQDSLNVAAKQKHDHKKYQRRYYTF